MESGQCVTTRKSNEGYMSTPFFRQLMVVSCTWNMMFMAGMCLGAPTVFIPQIRREANSTDAIDEATASWLYSLYGFSAMPWLAVILALTRVVGRKIPFLIATVSMLVVYFIFYFSTTTFHLLLAEILQGYMHAANATLNGIIISEYSSPKYRGFFLTVMAASSFWGIWVSNAIGTFFHWKYIALLGIVCCIHTFLVVLWPESPHWLASRGRFEECRTAYRWLNDFNENSECELQSLVDNQREYLRQRQENSPWNCVQYTSKEFYKPLLLVTVTIMQFHMIGKFVCSIYVLDIIKKITQNEGAAYTGMLILDGVTIFGIYVGCFLTSILKRRTMFFTFSTIGISFLFIVSFYLYLVKLAIVNENEIVFIVLLTFHSIAIGCGPGIMAMSIYVEVIPPKYKLTLYLIAAYILEISSTAVLKIAPMIFRKLGFDGSFFFYGLSASICTFILYIYLPETKDKTLQEIEECFKDNKQKENLSLHEKTDFEYRDKCNTLIYREHHSIS